MSCAALFQKGLFIKTWSSATSQLLSTNAGLVPQPATSPFCVPRKSFHILSYLVFKRHCQQQNESFACPPLSLNFAPKSTMPVSASSFTKMYTSGSDEYGLRSSRNTLANTTTCPPTDYLVFCDTRDGQRVYKHLSPSHPPHPQSTNLVIQKWSVERYMKSCSLPFSPKKKPTSGRMSASSPNVSKYRFSDLM
jgi:hypothetical protein